MKSFKQLITTPRASLIYRLGTYDILKNVNNNARWKILERKDLRTFFRDNFLIRQSFTEAIRKKHIGILVYSGTEWISYGWIRPAYSPAPRHLPRWIGGTNYPWVYNAYTIKKYRRMGYNTYLRKLRIDLIYEQAGTTDVDIYIDTMVNNIPARQSMLTTGFVPDGILTCYYIKPLKYLNYILYRNRWGYVWGDWDRGREHPAL
jgi:hypothetical protein